MIEQIQTLFGRVFSETVCSPCSSGENRQAIGALTSPNPPCYRTTGAQLLRLHCSSSVRWHSTVIQSARTWTLSQTLTLKCGEELGSHSEISLSLNLESQSARFARVCTVCICMCRSFILCAKRMTTDSTGSSKTHGQVYVVPVGTDLYMTNVNSCCHKTSCTSWFMFARDNKYSYFLRPPWSQLQLRTTMWVVTLFT